MSDNFFRNKIAIGTGAGFMQDNTYLLNSNFPAKGLDARHLR
jgi:hypothetical protein